MEDDDDDDDDGVEDDDDDNDGVEDDDDDVSIADVVVVILIVDVEKKGNGFVVAMVEVANVAVADET